MVGFLRENAKEAVPELFPEATKIFVLDEEAWWPFESISPDRSLENAKFLVLTPPSTSGGAPQVSSSGGVENIADLHELADWARQQKLKAKSVKVSEIGTDEWDIIRAHAGLKIKRFAKKASKVVGLDLKTATPFTWNEKTEPAHAKECLAHIERHIKGAFDAEEYQMFDARRYLDFLTVAGEQDELGFTIRGTTDVALVSRQAIAGGVPATGSRWLWELKKKLCAAGAVAEVGASAEEFASGATTSSAAAASIVTLQGAEEVTQAKYAFQAMACLLLANIKAPEERPGITLTDLRDQHVLYWMDGVDITYFAAPDAATAWALTRALLRDEMGSSSDDEEPLPQAIAAVAKRRKLELGKAHAGDAPSAQLADLADFLDLDEVRASQAACLLRQLRGLPAFSALPKPPPPGMYV
ncbi:g5156 [Coccomyxa elongata]